MNMSKVEKALRQSRILGSQREPQKTKQVVQYKRKHNQ